MLKLLDLFSGIGGFSLGLERSGASLGNSVVPQIPELIGLAIKQHMESINAQAA